MAWIPRRVAPAPRCRENPASGFSRAPARRAGYRRISDPRHKRRALRFREPSCFLSCYRQRRRAKSGFQAAHGGRQPCRTWFIKLSSNTPGTRRMIALLKRLSAPLRSRKAQLALAVRVTVAAFGALVAALALHLMLPLWAVLTSLIVTQMSVGRSLKASRDYLFGTVGGAIYGAAITVLIPHSGEAGLLALLVLAIAPLAFIAAINPSLNAATVTAVIVLLVPTISHADPLGSAIDRVMEVTVGAFTGLLVSFFVLPSRAHSQLRLSAARTLELIAAALAELLAGLTRGRDN